MRNWKNWLAPALTVLAVLVLAWLPLRLSRLQDESLAGRVHAEELGEDSNFPARSPELERRLGLLARWQEDPNALAVVGQELEDAEELEETGLDALEELEELRELGVLPGMLTDCRISGVSRFYLRDFRDLASTSFLQVSAFDRATGADIVMVVDNETGEALRLFLFSAALRKYTADPWQIGRAFLDRLDVEYETLHNSDTDSGVLAAFRLPESGVCYYVILDRDRLEIFPQTDWEPEEGSREGNASAVYS